MTSRKKRILTIQIIIFIIGSLLVFFTYYNKNNVSDLKKTSDLVKRNSSDTLENDQNINTFENIEYKGIDLNGNRYVIMSEKASFDVNKPELIDMKIMSAIFYFKDGTILRVKGDYGTYNNKSNDMEFRENIIANYIDNNLYADNLDYLNSKNLLTIYGNVKTESIKGNISADNIEIDISKRTVDISMFSDKQINMKLKN